VIWHVVPSLFPFRLFLVDELAELDQFLSHDGAHFIVRLKGLQLGGDGHAEPGKPRVAMRYRAARVLYVDFDASLGNPTRLQSPMQSATRSFSSDPMLRCIRMSSLLFSYSCIYWASNGEHDDAEHTKQDKRSDAR